MILDLLFDGDLWHVKVLPSFPVIETNNNLKLSVDLFFYIKAMFYIIIYIFKNVLLIISYINIFLHHI